MSEQPFSTRRELLRTTALGFGGLAFQALLAGSSVADESRSGEVSQPHFPARAKRVVFMFMKGGPSQVDTFDPKPMLDRDHFGTTDRFDSLLSKCQLLKEKR